MRSTDYIHVDVTQKTANNQIGQPNLAGLFYWKVLTIDGLLVYDILNMYRW